MRSWPSLALALALALAGCGTNDEGGPGTPPPEPDGCETSYLDHASFGEPFLLDWCTGCHSAALPASMRQLAPTGVDFDTLDGARRFGDRIAARASGPMPTMPPAGGPSAEERALLAEWIRCGAR